jgi:hypothetical protein
MGRHLPHAAARRMSVLRGVNAECRMLNAESSPVGIRHSSFGLPDLNDDLVPETAVNGSAEIVITFNRRHFEPAAARYGIEILAPAAAVRRQESPK